MARYLVVSALAASMGLLTGCGGPLPEGDAVHSGVMELRGEDGVLRRNSSGSAGHAADLKYFREQLAALRNSVSPDPGLTDFMAEAVSQLEWMEVQPAGDPSLNTLEDCGLSEHSLSATASPGMTYGSASASASMVELGPPSPWIKDVYTKAYATSVANTQSDTKFYQFMGGTYSQSSSASTGPAFCQVLYSITYIRARNCTGGYEGKSAQIDTCQ